jgi:hypothetical protein
MPALVPAAGLMLILVIAAILVQSSILHHKTFASLPRVCETPVDDRQDDRGNIGKVRNRPGNLRYFFLQKKKRLITS